MSYRVTSPRQAFGIQGQSIGYSSMLQDQKDTPLRYRPPLTQDELKRKIQQFASQIGTYASKPDRNSINLQDSPKERNDTYFSEDSPASKVRSSGVSVRYYAASQLNVVQTRESLTAKADELSKLYEPSLTLQDNPAKNISIVPSYVPRQVIVRNVGIQKNCKEQVEALDNVDTLRKVLNDIHEELYQNVPIKSRVQSKNDCDKVLSFAVETLQMMYDEILRLRGESYRE